MVGNAVDGVYHFEGVVDVWKVFQGGEVKEGVFRYFLVHTPALFSIIIALIKNFT